MGVPAEEVAPGWVGHSAGSFPPIHRFGFRGGFEPETIFRYERDTIVWMIGRFGFNRLDFSFTGWKIVWMVQGE